MIRYRAGYKYQLYEPYSVAIPIKPPVEIATDWIRLDADGNLFIAKGYAWDGPSGPTIDTANFMRGSLVHDALYQLMREKYLDEATWRETADNILYNLCREDGMSWWRAWYVLRAVRMFGAPSADPANDKPILTAP